jgi:IS30 family transposase
VKDLTHDDDVGARKWIDEEVAGGDRYPVANHVAIAERTTSTSTSAIRTHGGNSRWQRGPNETPNGLLRQYFAEGTDLSVFPADYLDYVAAKLGTRM